MSLLDSTESRPQVPSLGTALRLFNDALANRLDLAALELDETRTEAGTAAGLLGATFCLAQLAGFAFTLMVAALVWDSAHRGLWLAGLGGLYLAGCGCSVLLLRRRLRIWKPFAETKSQ